MYWLFAGDKYYPVGGMNDLRSTSDDLEELLALAKEVHEDGRFEYDWWHIVDSSSGGIVEEDWN